MSKLILTEREIEEITLKKQTKKQAEILTAWGIRHVLGRDGRLRVLRQDLAIPLYAGARRVRKAEPNLEGLVKRRRALP